MVWEENFSEPVLNESVWNFELGDGCPNLCGWGNNERQVYTTKNHEIKNGNLIIHAKKEGNSYTSTKITTKDKKIFQYGRMEARAKLPVGHGIWPAFWMLGANFKDGGKWLKSNSGFWSLKESYDYAIHLWLDKYSFKHDPSKQEWYIELILNKLEDISPEIKSFILNKLTDLNLENNKQFLVS